MPAKVAQTSITPITENLCITDYKNANIKQPPSFSMTEKTFAHSPSLLISSKLKAVSV